MTIEELINNRMHSSDPAWAVVFSEHDKIGLNHRGRSWTFETESEYQSFLEAKNLNVWETRNAQGPQPIEL